MKNKIFERKYLLSSHVGNFKVVFGESLKNHDNFIFIGVGDESKELNYHHQNNTIIFAGDDYLRLFNKSKESLDNCKSNLEELLNSKLKINLSEVKN